MINLFVNVSDPAPLKVELEHRNKSLRGLIHSVKVVFTKQHTTEGHVKLFLRTKQARDGILFLGKASILGKDYRIFPLDLNREVRRCYRCQQYGHTQHLCAKPAACGKCAGPIAHKNALLLLTRVFALIVTAVIMQDTESVLNKSKQ